MYTTSKDNAGIYDAALIGAKLWNMTQLKP